MKKFNLFLILTICIGCRTLGTVPLPSLSYIPRTLHQNSPSSAVIATTSTNRNKSMRGLSPNTYDPHPDINGYTHASRPETLIGLHNDGHEVKEFMEEVIILNGAPPNCSKENSVQVYLKSNDKEDAHSFIKYIAAESYANTAYLDKIYFKDDKLFIKGQVFNCQEKPQRPNRTKRQIYRNSSTEFDILAGSYVSRNGFLKSLGETGPTFGFNVSFFKPENANTKRSESFGWYIHFNFDHFVDTDSTFLKPKFQNEDFTNYLWSIWAAIRYMPTNYFQMNYNIGPAINFLEIDTGRTNQDLSDEEATRTTISIIHQLGFYFRIKNNIKYNNYSSSDQLIGLNILYYWMPDPLGEFAVNNTDLESYEGGSFAFLLSWKLQSI